MDPFLLLGILAVVIGLVGVIVLMKGKRRTFAESEHRISRVCTPVGGTT